jgi:cadmium resistance protein CadD (predicted permease)
MKIFKIKNNLEPILSFLLGASIIINVNGTFNFMYYITGILLILLGIHTFIFEKNDDDEDEDDNEIDFPFE